MSVYEQIKEYCKCEESITNADIDEAINLASLLTCWADASGSTFLRSERQEYTEIHTTKNGNIKDILTFKPRYKNFDTDSFVFQIEIFNKTSFEKESFTIAEENIIFDELTDTFYIKTVDYKEPVIYCGGCKEEIVYRLIVNYVAGYELLPEYLLPVFCDLVEIVHAKNICVCPNCESCNNSNGREGQTIIYADGDVVTVQLKETLGATLVNTYIKQLEMISICEPYLSRGVVV